MEQYQGRDIDPALWFYVPLSRAALLALVDAATAGLPAVRDGYSGFALGALGQFEDWLSDVSTQRLNDE